MASFKFFYYKSFAFLAILSVLLIISTGTVFVRSYILRRRYQRRLEDHDALGPGQLLTSRAQGSKIKRLGSMPKIINAWLAEGGDKWNQMMVSLHHFTGLYN